MRTVLILGLALLTNAGYAQFKNIQLDKGGDYACEPSIAINLKNPNNIVAGSVLDNVYVTHDGGKTWTQSKLTSSMGVYGDPAIFSDSKGNFYYFHLSDPTKGQGDFTSEMLDRIVVQSSTDDGKTWSDGAGIGLNHPKDQDKQWATIDNKGNIIVTWTQFDTYGDSSKSCQSNILLSMSKNGKKWSDPVVISQTPGDCVDSDNTAEGAVPAVTFDGKMFVTWSSQGKIFMDRSFDGGATWLSNDVFIAQQPGGWDLKIPGHDRANGMPVLMANNGPIHLRGMLCLLWADQRNGENDTDIWFTRSANYGDNWAEPIRINDDRPGKHQYLPWMAIDQTTGFIYVVYYDRRSYDDNQTDVYLAWSEDQGASFTNVKISETPFTPSETSFFGDYTNIAAHKGIITPIWARMDDGKTSIMTAVIRHEDLKKLQPAGKK